MCKVGSVLEIRVQRLPTEYLYRQDFSGAARCARVLVGCVSGEEPANVVGGRVGWLAGLANDSGVVVGAHPAVSGLAGGLGAAQTAKQNGTIGN